MVGKWMRAGLAAGGALCAAGAALVVRKKVMGITPEMILAIAPEAPILKLPEYLAALLPAMKEGKITGRLRQAAFLAQLLHESDRFRALKEYGDGMRYEGHQKLGNTVPGDGPRFIGRGWIQLTGRYNYTAAGKALGLDLVNKPELAAQPVNAARIAVWYWNDRGLSVLADKGDFEGITRKIQGALGHLPQRLALYQRALQVL